MYLKNITKRGDIVIELPKQATMGPILRSYVARQGSTLEFLAGRDSSHPEN